MRNIVIALVKSHFQILVGLIFMLIFVVFCIILIQSQYLYHNELVQPTKSPNLIRLGPIFQIIPQILQYILCLFNKTHQTMDMHPYAGSYAQSLNFGEQDTHSQSSTYKVNVVAFKQLPRCISRQFSDFGDLSIEEDFHHQSTKPDAKAYKCFKCFGKQKNHLNNAAPTHCRQCSGSEYITEHHPLVAIMEQIIKKKMPHIEFKVEEQKKHESKRELLELEYGCRDVIKEQSFSYQQQSPPFCRNCNKQCDPKCYRICQKCPDFNICEICFQKKRFFHHHQLILKDASKMPSKISHAPFNMKKISEQVDSQSSNCLQDLQLKCSNCNEPVDVCYDECTTCQQNGIKYIICNTCSEYQSYAHSPSHVLVMRTVTQMSDLKRLHSGVSENGSNLQINSLSNSHIKYELGDSLQGSHSLQSPFGKDSQVLPDQIKFNLSDHNFGQQLLGEKLSHSYHNDGQQRIARKKQLQDALESSLNRIELQSSFQIGGTNHYHEEPLSPALSFVPIFNTLTHEPTQKPLRSNPEDQYVFNDYQCDICGTQPIRNKRYHCSQCENFDLCQECYIVRSKRHAHRTFEEIDGRQLIKQRDSIIKLSQSKNLQVASFRPKSGVDLRSTHR